MEGGREDRADSIGLGRIMTNEPLQPSLDRAMFTFVNNIDSCLVYDNIHCIFTSKNCSMQWFCYEGNKVETGNFPEGEIQCSNRAHTQPLHISKSIELCFVLLHLLLCNEF